MKVHFHRSQTVRGHKVQTLVTRRLHLSTAVICHSPRLFQMLTRIAQPGHSGGLCTQFAQEDSNAMIQTAAPESIHEQISSWTTLKYPGECYLQWQQASSVSIPVGEHTDKIWQMYTLTESLQKVTHQKPHQGGPKHLPKHAMTHTFCKITV